MFLMNQSPHLASLLSFSLLSWLLQPFLNPSWFSPLTVLFSYTCELTLSSFKPATPMDLLMFSVSREKAMEGLTTGRLSLNSVNKILQSLGSILPPKNNERRYNTSQLMKTANRFYPRDCFSSSYLEFSFLQGPRFQAVTQGEWTKPSMLEHFLIFCF